MGVIFEMTKAYLDSQGIRYRSERDDTALRIGMSGLDNIGTMQTLVFFDDNDRTVSIKSFNLCQVPENKKDAVYAACNSLNESYRWVTFFVDEDDNTITAQDDAVVQADSSGNEIFELILRMAKVVDQAYPTLMKAVWG